MSRPPTLLDDNSPLAKFSEVAALDQRTSASDRSRPSLSRPFSVPFSATHLPSKTGSETIEINEVSSDPSDDAPFHIVFQFDYELDPTAGLKKGFFTITSPSGADINQAQLAFHNFEEGAKATTLIFGFYAASGGTNEKCGLAWRLGQLRVELSTQAEVTLSFELSQLKPGVALVQELEENGFSKSILYCRVIQSLLGNMDVNWSSFVERIVQAMGTAVDIYGPQHPASDSFYLGSVTLASQAGILPDEDRVKLLSASITHLKDCAPSIQGLVLQTTIISPLMNLGMFDLAISAADSAISLEKTFTHLSNSSHMHHARLDRAGALMQLGRFQEGLDQAEELLAQLEKQHKPDQAMLLALYSMISAVTEPLELFERQREILKKEIQLRQVMNQLENPGGVLAYERLAQAHAEAGNWKQTLAMYLKARSLHLKIGRPKMSDAYADYTANIISCTVVLGMEKMISKDVQSLIEVAGGLTDPEVTLSIGSFAVHGPLKGTTNSIALARQVAQATENQSGSSSSAYAKALCNLAACQEGNKKYRSAKGLYEQAKEIADAADDADEALHLQIRLGLESSSRDEVTYAFNYDGVARLVESRKTLESQDNPDPEKLLSVLKSLFFVYHAHALAGEKREVATAATSLVESRHGRKSDQFLDLLNTFAAVEMVEAEAHKYGWMKIRQSPTQ